MNHTNEGLREKIAKIIKDIPDFNGQATDAILSLIEDCVPKEADGSMDTFMVSGYNTTQSVCAQVGFTRCRDAMLKAIRGEKKV